MNKLSAQPDVIKYCITDYLTLPELIQVQNTSRYNLNSFFKYDVIIPSTTYEGATKILRDRCRQLRSIELRGSLTTAGYLILMQRIASAPTVLQTFSLKSDSSEDIIPAITSLSGCINLHTLKIHPPLSKEATRCLAASIPSQSIRTLSISPFLDVECRGESLGMALGKCKELQHLRLKNMNEYPHLIRDLLQPIQAATLHSFKFCVAEDNPPFSPDAIAHLGDFLARCTSLRKLHYRAPTDGSGPPLMPLFQKMAWTIPTIHLSHHFSDEELNFFQARPWAPHQVVHLENIFQSGQGYQRQHDFIAHLSARCQLQLSGHLGLEEDVSDDLLRELEWNALGSHVRLPIFLFGEAHGNTWNMEYLKDPNCIWQALSYFGEFTGNINLTKVKLLDFSNDERLSAYDFKNVVLPLVKRCPALTDINLIGTRTNYQDIEALKRAAKDRPLLLTWPLYQFQLTPGNNPIRVFLSDCPPSPPPLNPMDTAPAAAAAAPSKKRPLDPVPPQADGAPPPPKKPHTDPDEKK
jgi:hypothetical protein